MPSVSANVGACGREPRSLPSGLRSRLCVPVGARRRSRAGVPVSLAACRSVRMDAAGGPCRGREEERREREREGARSCDVRSQIRSCPENTLGNCLCSESAFIWRFLPSLFDYDRRFQFTSGTYNVAVFIYFLHIFYFYILL